MLRDKGSMLRARTVVDATLVASPSSTTNAGGGRDPEMHQTKKGNPWHFGMKVQIRADAESGLVHTARGTAANVNDVVEAASLVHADESDAFGDAGFQDSYKRPDAPLDVEWHVAMRRGKPAALDKSSSFGTMINEVECIKASIRAKVEHPLRVVRRQFGFVKVRYRGLKKILAQLTTLFALCNLWRARDKLLGAQAGVRLLRGPAA